MDDLTRQLLDVVKASPNLSDREKRQIVAAIRFRPRVRDEIMGEIKAACYVEDMPTDRLSFVDDAVDWNKIIDIIKDLLPIILKILSLW